MADDVISGRVLRLLTMCETICVKQFRFKPEQ